jgi:hypothetical protein
MKAFALLAMLAAAVTAQDLPVFNNGPGVEVDTSIRVQLRSEGGFVEDVNIIESSNAGTG